MSDAVPPSPETIVPIPGAPGYVVSSKGRILRETRSASNRAPYYPRVTLRVNMRSIQRFVHTLVMTAFGPPKPFPEAIVRHWDGDGRNSRPDNLVWGTYVENSEDMRRHGTMTYGTQRWNAVLTDDDVRQLRTLRAAGMSYDDLGKKFGICRQQASEVARGLHWKHVA